MESPDSAPTFTPYTYFASVSHTVPSPRDAYSGQQQSRGRGSYHAFRTTTRASEQVVDSEIGGQGPEVMTSRLGKTLESRRTLSLFLIIIIILRASYSLSFLNTNG